MKPVLVHNVLRLALSIKSPRKNKGLDDLVLEFVVSFRKVQKVLTFQSWKKELAQFCFKTSYKTKDRDID